MKPVGSGSPPIWPRLRRIDTPNVVCANLGDMSNAIIRSATRDDLPGVLDLYRHLHPDDPHPDSMRAEAAWSALLDSGLTVVVVAAIDGLLVSSCTLAVIPNLTRGARSYGVIENVVTHPGHRRIGLGRSVLASALKAAWNANCYKVMLATGSPKPETLQFYESAGFERGGKTFFQARRP